MTAEVQGERDWEGQMSAREQGRGQAGEMTARGQGERGRTGEMTSQGQGEGGQTRIRTEEGQGEGGQTRERTEEGQEESGQMGEITVEGQGDGGQKRGRTDKRQEKRGQKKGRTEEGQEEKGQRREGQGKRGQKRERTEEGQEESGQKRERTEEGQEQRGQKRERTEEGQEERGQKRERTEKGQEERGQKRERTEEEQEERGQKRERTEEGQEERGQKRERTEEGQEKKDQGRVNNGAGQEERGQKREKNKEGQEEKGQKRERTEERHGERGQEEDRERVLKWQETGNQKGKGSQEKQLTVHDERGQKGERTEEAQRKGGQEDEKAEEGHGDTALVGEMNADGQENRDQVDLDELETRNGPKTIKKKIVRVSSVTKTTSGGRQNQCTPEEKLMILRPIPKNPNEIVVFKLEEPRKGTEFSLKVVKETLESVMGENFLAQAKYSKISTKNFPVEVDRKFLDIGADFDVCGKSFKFVHGRFNIPKSSFQVYIVYGSCQFPRRVDRPPSYTMRLKTFRNFPGNAKQSAIKLADWGFIYVGAGVDDMVVCWFCQLSLTDMRWSDDIPHLHRYLSPNCPMVRSGLHENGLTTPPQLDCALEASAGTCNGPKRGASVSTVRASDTIDNIVVSRAVNEKSNGTTLDEKGISTEKPQHLLQSQLRQRLETMGRLRLPKDKHDLAKAGFFYNKEDSTFCCFFCGVCVHNWDPDDNVWIRHAQNSPQCFWLKMKTGELFIELVQTSQDQVNSCVAV